MEARRIPPAHATRCNDCAATLDATAPGVGEYVSGIAVNRRSGGANTITERRGTGRYLCAECVTRHRQGIPWEQGVLW